MIIKKYIVDEMQQAIQQIKRELGPEAIIVSSHKIRGRGITGFLKRKIEVTAVLDKKEKEEDLKIKAVKELPPSTQVRPVKETAAPASNAGMKSAGKEETGAVVYDNRGLVRSRPKAEGGDLAPGPLLPTEFKPLLEEEIMKSMEQREKGMLLNMLEQQLEEMGTVQDKEFNRRWLKILTAIDIDRGIAQQLLKDLEGMVAGSAAGRSDDMAQVALINRVAELLKPAYENYERSKILAFVGPPGVGKTTTLAKLATRYKLLENKKIALITVYTYRYGTAEQLKVYGDAIDVPVEVVMTPAELRQAVESHRDKDYILIDTVGRSSKNTGQVLELKGFLEAVNGPKEIYLVMGAGIKDRDLMRFIKDFQMVHYTGYIFTKVDETETLGSMLNVVLRTGIPVCYYTGGQSIPDDIEDLQPRKMAQLVFRSVDSYAGDN